MKSMWIVNRNELRALIDDVWNAATESEQVPAVKWADEIIDKWIAGAGPGPSTQETPDEPVEGVVRGSELEKQIQAARKTIAGWPDDVKAAMGVAVETGTARCPHGYELANLADGTDTCSGCSTVNR